MGRKTCAGWATAPARFSGSAGPESADGCLSRRFVLMFKRMVVMLVAMAALISIIGFVKFRRIQASTGGASSFQPPPEAVTTIGGRQELWQGSPRAHSQGGARQWVATNAPLRS